MYSVYHFTLKLKRRQSMGRLPCFGEAPMPNPADQLYQDAIRLPREEQIHLVEKLLENIGENIDPEVEAAQIKEVKRRIQEVREGKSKLIPGDQVLK
jgi:putative addiction module component (TIGR02574 family)